MRKNAWFGLISNVGCTLIALGASAQDAPAPPAEAPPTAPAPPAETTPPAEAPPPAEPPAAPAAPPADAAPAPAPEAAPPADPSTPAAPAAPATSAAPAPAPEAPAEAAPSGEAAATLEAATEPEPEPEPEAEEIPEEVPEADKDVEEILVTGSRIKRSSFAAAAPVEVITREQLEYSGASNLEDVVQYLTVAQGSGYSGNAGSPSTVTANLRGLGVGATLTLINGRRVVQSGGGISSNFVDLATIPVSLIDRVEILKGGASAIYGSDAVAGVINIITKDKWDGAEIQLGGDTTTRWDHQVYNASLALGTTSERSRVSAAITYERRNQLLLNERDWSTRGNTISRLGNPGSFVVGISPQPDPDCEQAEGSAIDEGICTYDRRDFVSLIGNLERFNLFVTAGYDITSHTQAFTEIAYMRLRSDSLPLLGGPTVGLINFDTRDAMLDLGFPIVPADHVDNPFGQDAAFIGRSVGRTGKVRRDTAADDTLRAVAGLRGDFEDAFAGTLAEDWEWEAYGTWGASRYRGLLNDTLKEPFVTALNSCSDPRDLSGCYNPFYSSILGTGTPNSQEVLDSFLSAMTTQTDQGMHSANAGMTGGLFELPGGDFAFALGGEFRHESRSTELDHDANQTRYSFLGGNTDAIAGRDIFGAYLEFVAPIYSGVELQIAGRYEEYEDAGTSANPTAGITVVPAEIVGRDNVIRELRLLQLRGHVARSFRAPTLYQSFPGFVLTPATVTDQSSPFPVLYTARNFGNMDLGAERSTALSGGFTWSVWDELMLTSDYWWYDYEERIVLEASGPRALEAREACMEGRMWDARVDISNTMDCGINTVDTTFIQAESVKTDGLDFNVIVSLTGETFGGNADDWGRITLGAQGTYTFRFLLQEEVVEDRDFVDDPDTDEDESERDPLPPPNCSDGECNVVGQLNTTNFAPAIPFRVNFPLSWAHAGHVVSSTLHYIGEIDNDARVNLDGSYETVDSMITLDLQYAYTLDDEIGKATTIQVGATNLLDAEPPEVRGVTNGASAMHDPRGRMVYGQLIQEF
ncbi:MAG: TonB-dependent receptor [Myxococcales bacterium]|nr:TonB-dependent receptor [Myxococcales bacterium]